MSKDFDIWMKEINKTHQEFYKKETKVAQNLDNISFDITSIRKDIKILNNKIDLILDMMENIFISLSQEDDTESEEYESNEGWIPEQWNEEDDSES